MRPEPDGGPEDGLERPARRPPRNEPLPPRSRDGGAAPTPPYRADLRGRRAERPALLFHGVYQRGQPGPADSWHAPAGPRSGATGGGPGPDQPPRHPH